MQLLETIRYAGGTLENLYYHNDRLNRSRKALWQQYDRLDLEDLIPIPDNLADAPVYRCRVLVSEAGIDLAEFIPYTKREVRSLQVRDAGELDYAHKYADRTALQEKAEGIEADEVLFVRNGLLTDTSYANVAVFDGSEWYTPHQPLLAGTHRARLLATGRVIPERLAVDDLKYFREIRLFNAMMTWDESPTLPVTAIRL
ncbi:aminotransferase class IV [Siphonobacter aquaeclarae]|uniref:4-amino-4-deoxychorismate lyase n=1 Tax=Siphonobacter aquaeclarae TaxID=563176 RepID=A0A1G9UK70_9BACT|nr:aminotransferase class IV [Siphonobacter aquaeclarae]SDM60214.1 4-amino-4-deoxychorismate lyase [Siphonobacter aquaeclarae]